MLENAMRTEASCGTCVANPIAPMPLPAEGLAITMLRQPFHLLAAGAAGAQAMLATWQRRSRARHELEQMDEHLLTDVGLTRDQVLQEAAKPFWIE
jgi:uncharacterized protein YjiS (DUF1127 family)